MRVDLPAPFSPQIAWISCSATVRDTSLSATTPGNRLVMDRISRMLSVMGALLRAGPRRRAGAGTLRGSAKVDCSELAGLDLLLGVVAGIHHGLLVVA